MPTYVTRATLALLLLCVACGARGDGGDGAADDAATLPDETGTTSPAQPTPDADSGAALPPRPATRQDTVMIEGMPEVEEQTLVSSPAGFAAPFSTYVPEGMESVFDPPNSVRFVAAFAGTRDDDAFMEVRVQEAGSPRLSANDVLERLMNERAMRGYQNAEADLPSWAQDAVNFRATAAEGTSVVGGVVVMEHAGRQVHVIRHYPGEYGDGLGPRLHTILSEWRWEDTGTMLMQ